MPNFVKTMVGSGLPPASANAIGGFVDNNVTATGNSQATAYAVTMNDTFVTTTGSSTGVILPTGLSPGDDCFIANLGANTLAVYPPVGGKINNGTTNAAVNITTLKCCWCTVVSSDGLNWALLAGA